MFNTQTNLGAGPQQRPALARRRDQGDAGLCPSRARGVLDDYLALLSRELAETNALVDVVQVQETLLALSSFLRFAYPGIAGDDYRRILDRLTEIYALGIPQTASQGFKMTAGGYAGVIETISHAYPTYDYGEAVGQLLCYMIRLFKAGSSSWKTVFEHVLAMPETVEAKRWLGQPYFLQVQEWAEAGVDNLFSIRQGICERIGELAAKERERGREIAASERDLLADRQKQPRTAGNVIDLAQRRGARAIDRLRRERQILIEEKAAKEFLVGLIDDDIREFEGKLQAMRRAYYLQLV